MEDRWRLDPREVVSGYESERAPETMMSSPPGGLDVREYAVWLEHEPTGIRVSSQVPDGHYTARQLQMLEIEVRKSLFAELELKVARRLGVTGV